MFHVHLSTVLITLLELITFISSVLQENIIECSIIDNHLHSDHIAVKLYLQIGMSYIVEIDRPYGMV